MEFRRVLFRSERHEADHVQHQDEHEEREDIGRIFAAFGADIGVHHAGNEAGEALDGDLPATGNELALHPADHKDPEQEARDHHPHRAGGKGNLMIRSEEHTSELQSLMRISYAVFGLKKKNKKTTKHDRTHNIKEHKQTKNNKQ